MSSRKRFQLQAAGGVLIFLFIFWLGWMRQREPFYTFFYLYAWCAFDTAADVNRVWRDGGDGLADILGG